MKRTALCLLAAASMATSHPVSAQTTEEQDTAVVTYDKAFFEKYSPVTLVDILERIPGVPAILNQRRRGPGGGGDRGFGSSGEQILLNGKRISAKSNSVRDILSKTPASRVEKVELIRGARDGLDVQSEGLIVNVVLNESDGSGSVFWKVGGTYRIGKKTSPEFEVSYENKSGNLDYTISAEGRMLRGNFSRDDVYYDENDTITGEKDMDGEFRVNMVDLNSNVTYNFDGGDVLNLNGNFKPIHAENDQLHIETGDDAETLFWDFEEDFIVWEVGGDYSTDLGALGKLKTVFLAGGEVNSDFGTKRFNGVGPARYLYNEEILEFATSEKILRASLTKAFGKKHSIEFGGEGAFNRFRQKLDNFERDDAPDPLILDSSTDVKIREDRFEIFAHHNYTISSRMVLQSSLTAEFSEIISDTLVPGNTVRIDNNFTFLKPRFNFRYDFGDRDQLRLLAEKKVSQLEFFHYMTFFDQQEQELKFGNNNIRPEQIWEFSATYEHRLKNDGGTLEIELFYHDYKDYIARAEFSEFVDFGGNRISSDRFFALPPDATLRDSVDYSSKPGNIDHASGYGLILKNTTRLGFVGLQDAQFSVEYEYKRRRYFDPISAVDKGFSWVSDHNITLNYRHDLTKIAMSYGFEAKFRSDYQHRDITYDWHWKGEDEYEIFVEKQIFGDLKLRLEAKQERITNGKATFFRYRDHIRFNDPSGRDEQYHDRPYEVSIDLSGTF